MGNDVIMDLMDTTEEVTAIPRKVLTVFFLIDVSGSMSGAKIGAVNSAMEEVLVELQDVEGADCEIKVAVLKFSDGCEWLTPRPINLTSDWIGLEADGLTDFQAACRELDNKLSVSHGFMQSASGCFAPVIMLLTDGYPTDDTDNGDNGISILKKNNWFKAAVKVAIAIGDSANKTLCENFTGNIERVAVAHNPEFLKKVIKKVTVTSSQISSSSKGIISASVGVKDPLESTEANKEVGDIIQGLMTTEDSASSTNTIDENSIVW